MTGDTASREIIDRLSSYPRCHLAHLPTPLERMSRLSKTTGMNLMIKRDDQTGLALGGNKVRKLEYVMADVLAQNADCMITWSGIQSNWSRQMVAAARKMGVSPSASSIQAQRITQ